MTENYKRLYETTKKMLAKYQDEIVPEMRRLLDKRVEVVRCGECKNYHKSEGFCDLHSHFIDDNNVCCSPAESPNWTMFDEDDFCSYGGRRESDEQTK